MRAPYASEHSSTCAPCARESPSIRTTGTERAIVDNINGFANAGPGESSYIHALCAREHSNIRALCARESLSIHMIRIQKAIADDAI